MTVGELRRYLGTLPLDSNDWEVAAYDPDTAHLSTVRRAMASELGPGRNAVVLVVRSKEA